MLASLRRWLGGTADAHVAELHDVLLRSARRCAYDLRHAADEIADQRLRKGFGDRADMWVGIFASGNALKDYRLELHREIQKRDVEIARLRTLCEANGVSPVGPNELPF
jgi:hypothetical protein